MWTLIKSSVNFIKLEDGCTLINHSCKLVTGHGSMVSSLKNHRSAVNYTANIPQMMHHCKNRE